MRKPNQKLNLIRVLRENPGSSTEELAELLGISRNACEHYVGPMKSSTPREVYISSWDRVCGKGKHTPRYTLGDQPNAPYPKPLTQRARGIAYRKRNKAIRVARDRKDKSSPLLGNPFTQLYALAGVTEKVSQRASLERRKSGESTLPTGTRPTEQECTNDDQSDI